MIKKILVVPFIYITILFLDIFTYYGKNEIRTMVYNSIYGFLLSLFYGFFIGGFLSIIFINSSDSIWAVIISCIVFLMVINITISIKYKEEKLVLPNQYIIIFSLITLILSKKYILISIIKMLGLSFLLTFIFLNILTFLNVSLNNTLVVIIVIGIILFTITLLYRNRIDSFKHAVNQFLLIFNLVVIIFMIGALRLSMYSQFYSYTTWLDISLIILSIVSFLLTALPLAPVVYERFKDEFDEAYRLFWNEMVNLSGYNDIKKDLKIEVSDLLDGLDSLKKEWKMGNKKEIIKRSFISILLIVILFTFLNLLVRYGDNMRELIQIYSGDLYSQWSSLFKDESKAKLTLVLGVTIQVFIYFVYKLFDAIKNNHLVSNILIHISRFIFVVLLLLILTISIFSIELNTIFLTIIIVLFISLVMLIKIQDWLKKKGK